ncbi:thiamine-phosphate kinase [Aureibacillus halotolerans]|uniref:thiamine-phosphate kinase n=1 Tax=Aureibacillus halotolerans TaxID=1508390 RepID=UPI00105B70CD|nr:thiamine-phosphate kinase [Aureibacillus halotolerans]
MEQLETVASALDEFQLIRAITPKTHYHEKLILGIGDDAAVFRPDDGKNIVVCQDQMVEGTHFTKTTMGMSDVGYKALAANISDIAAMGAWPAYYLVTLTIPKHTNKDEIRDLYKGMQELASFYSMDLIGGDTTSGPALIINVTVLGYADPKQILTRSGAQPGDVLFVTGFVGESGAGLDTLLKNGRHMRFLDMEAEIVRTHQRPVPRCVEGRLLREAGSTCANDISDGLASELWEIAEASSSTLVIEEDAIQFRGYMLTLERKQALQYAFSGGEDFELVGTIAADKWPLLEELFKAKTSVPVTRIGYVESGPSRVLSRQTGRVLEKSGYNHLSKGDNHGDVRDSYDN